MRTSSPLALVALLACAPLFAQPADALDLAGEWRVQLSEGKLPANWNVTQPSQSVRLPGSIQAQGLGGEVSTATKWIGGVRGGWKTAPEYAPYRKTGSAKIPFWFQPERHFIGAATFRREIEVPAAWAGKRVILSLERAHTLTKLWVDGREIGSDNSLSTPHVYDLGRLAPGKHEITLGVNNHEPAPVGENSHAISDHMQTAWNGVVGKLVMEATPDSRIAGVEISPDVSAKRIGVTWSIAGAAATGAKLSLTAHAPDGKKFTREVPADAGRAELSLGEAVSTWDEFQPNLYRLEAVLLLPNGESHRCESSFGMVDYKVDGKHFLVNGRRTTFRGTLDCAMFPMTGYPSTDVDYWKREIAVVKSHGLNHIRFHSWCPPEAAFKAADELGCYLLIEHAWGAPDAMGDYVMGEAERVVRTYGNHPSFAMHAYGNEPSGGVAWMERFAKHFRERDPRRYYAGSTGWPRLKNNQYHSQMDGLRDYPWGAGLKAGINADEPNSMKDFGKTTASENKPFISHETGQWCVYPDFDEIPKYTGFLKARNFEIFRDFLTANHMGDQARDFLMASGRLQTICYKNEVEKLRRTPDIGGYQLLGLNDFPGQGTALVGAVNPLWETKPYTSAAEYARFNGPTVTLARLPKYVYTPADTLTAEVQISHDAAAPIAAATPVWKIKSASGIVLAEGALPPRDIPVGQSSLGSIQVPLAKIAAPAQLKFVVGLAGSSVENDWDIWVYPDEAPRVSADGLVRTHDVAEALAKAESGASVLLTPPPAAVVSPKGPKVVFGFSTVFWNTVWTDRQPPTTLGILCHPKHPVFAQFPTDYHTNYQWWYPIRRTAKVLSLQGQDPALRPLIQVIDDWFTARRLGLLVEMRFGKGRLMVSAIDFAAAPASDRVTAQLRASVLAYMKSPAFAPTVSVSREQIAAMVSTVSGDFSKKP